MRTTYGSRGRQRPASPSARRTDGRTAHRRAFGSGSEDRWLQDLEADGLEVYVAKGDAMVLVYREPIHADPDRRAYVRKGVLEVGAAELSLVNGPELLADPVTHGVYGGRLGGVPVRMDQLVKVRNGVPVAIVQVLQCAGKPLVCSLHAIMRRFLGTEGSAAQA